MQFIVVNIKWLNWNSRGAANVPGTDHKNFGDTSWVWSVPGTFSPRDPVEPYFLLPATVPSLFGEG